MNTVLEVKNLQKSYGPKQAVKDVSFSISKNEIVALLGPNGAGKTTTLSMILGVLTPTSGSIRLHTHSLEHDRTAFLEQTNFAAAYAQLPGNLSVIENLRIFGMIYCIPDREEKIQALLSEFNLEKFRNTKVGLLSSGEQMRVSLAKAMLNNPQLLLLDEPTSSLDPSTAEIIREGIRTFAHAGSGCVLWTSHNMHEVTAVCDRVLFLSHGKILLEGDPKTLPEMHGKKNLEELFIAVAREPLSFDLE